MAKRDNHYEAAFESYLRTAGIPYVAVDEARRAVMADGRSLKSLDFLVAPPGPVTWLVDVKGRRFPSGLEHHQYWKNWSTHDDLESLREWEILFGDGFRGLFVFAFHVIGRRLPLAPELLVTFRGERYAFLGVELSDYQQMCYLLSPQWQTVAVAARRFREVARPIQTIFSGGFSSAAPLVCEENSACAMRPVSLSDSQ
ncbi:MAG: HYExAFE family protein [Thermogutta sp.]